MNPYRWDPSAHLRGKCPVCAIGLPGCPRCFTLPPSANGDPTKPSDFEFDPQRDKQRVLDREKRIADAQLKKKRKAEIKALEKGKRALLRAENSLSPEDEEFELSSESSGSDSGESDSSAGESQSFSVHAEKRERRLRREARKRRRQERAHKREEDSESESSNEEEPEIEHLETHTRLTTIHGIRNF